MLEKKVVYNYIDNKIWGRDISYFVAAVSLY